MEVQLQDTTIYARDLQKFEKPLVMEMVGDCWSNFHENKNFIKLIISIKMIMEMYFELSLNNN